MPLPRRLKPIALAALLLTATFYYLTTAAHTTTTSPFYTRTVAAINDRESADARAAVIAEERLRQEKVDRLEREHNAAVAAAAESNDAPLVAEPAQQKIMGAGAEGKPLAVKDGAAKGKGDKVVQSAVASDDGVAKVGNVDAKAAQQAEIDETALEHEVETELNDILRRSPIIVFSKSYCPHSKKAKHILLDLLSITPPPHVVELDQHPLGARLQAALGAMTGRRTVPNVLINGKSIGGGDEVSALYAADELVGTVKGMAGKRVVGVEKVVVEEEEQEEGGRAREMKFRA